MPFLYHMVPEHMSGTVLYPLNALAATHPDVYAAEADKYAERMHVMEYRVPTLGCRWNDVLHLTAVEPQDLVRALTEAGRAAQAPQRFFKIDVTKLDPSVMTVYLYTNTGPSSVGVQPAHEEFVAYDPRHHAEFARIPEETKAYYRKMYAEGKRPLRFRGVPHILYKGPIDVSDVEVVTAQP